MFLVKASYNTWISQIPSEHASDYGSAAFVQSRENAGQFTREVAEKISVRFNPNDPMKIEEVKEE